MIALIDGDSIAYIAGADKVEHDAYTNERIVLEKDEALVEEQAFDILNEIFKNTGATEYLLFLTGPGNFRYQIYPEYKANRKGVDPPRFMKYCKTYLSSLQGVYTTEGIEADDAVAILRKKYVAQGKECIICSPDKDILMLPGKHFNYRKMEFVNTTQAEADYAFWTDVIAGQSGDNIKGIPGKGPAFAKKAFEEGAGKSYRTIVLDKYVEHFGEDLGITEFYKNYKVLKIQEESTPVLDGLEPCKVKIDLINNF